MTYHIFYDTETTGPEPTYDQVLQFAGILVDDDFNEIDTIDVRSRLVPHIVPTAGALKVTHVDPYDIARAPHSPLEFARLIHNVMTDWSSHGPTSFAGYNTIRFDEEIVRQMFWQALLDPYLTSGRNKMRNDYLITMRALHARNPEVIDFPINPETGKKNFKLENIAPANGFTGHDAHDALGDVRATIFAARMIRDIDPHLFEHMLAMGNANTARDFVDNEVVFQMLGGPMLNPGVLDACLIGSEKTNPKSKTAWNLAIDPLPYLDLSAEEILQVMKTPGTPFRTIKCNKQPGIFPMNWGFMNRVSTDEYQPADQVTIDERVEMIRNHEAFQATVVEALSLKTQSYDAPQYLEEKIYTGFPSNKDKSIMQRFHNQPDWSVKLELVRELKKDEMRHLGLRAVFANSPETLTDTLRSNIDKRLAQDRFTLATDRPWTTVGKLMSELDEWLEKDPDDPELLNILKWALETYPVAREWEAYKAKLAKAKEDESELPAPPEQEVSDPLEEQAAETPQEQAPAPHEVSVEAASVNYLDGLE